MHLHRLTTFDILKILGYVVATGAMLTPETLHYFGVPETSAQVASTIIGRIILAATLVSNVIKNPSAPSGTSPVYAAHAAPPVVIEGVPAEKGKSVS